MSDNQLTAFHKYFIVMCEKLSYLSLENNTVTAKDCKDILNALQITFLRSEHFSFCCFVRQNTKCSARKPFYMSCSNLLLNNSMSYLFCIPSFLVIVINVLHIFLQKKCGKAQAYDYIVCFITVTDVIGSVPLFILWIGDFYFNDNFVERENQWRSSVTCFLSCGINIYYTLTSPFLCFSLSYTRFEVVKNPIDSNFKRSCHVLRIIMAGCSFCLCFATL